MVMPSTTVSKEKSPKVNVAVPASSAVQVPDSVTVTLSPFGTAPCEPAVTVTGVLRRASGRDGLGEAVQVADVVAGAVGERARDRDINGVADHLGGRDLDIEGGWPGLGAGLCVQN
jgi:hypothetical protein